MTRLCGSVAIKLSMVAYYVLVDCRTTGVLLGILHVSNLGEALLGTSQVSNLFSTTAFVFSPKVYALNIF